MNRIKAEIIADSINEFGNRITTFVATFPRIILAELNTHRALSRNSASSRAIPFKKMMELVKNEPFIPIKWQEDHSGMQGTKYFDDITQGPQFEIEWLVARDMALSIASQMNNRGLTKQICNRLLEPFLYHTAIITGTEWENFFALRAHDQAEIHIAELAHKMLEAYNCSKPKLLKAGEWHIPFGDKINDDRVIELIPEARVLEADTLWDAVQFEMIRIATARCARVSYLNFEGKDDYEADIKLCSRLLSSGHMSPFEHCAKAMDSSEYHIYTRTEDLVKMDLSKMTDVHNGWCGNFKGFIQWRKMLPDENKKDERTRQVLAV